MRHGLDLTHVRMECGLDQILSVTGDRGACDVTILRHLVVDILKHLNDRGDRLASIVFIESIQNIFIVIHDHGLGRGRTGIDP